MRPAYVRHRRRLLLLVCTQEAAVGELRAMFKASHERGEAGGGLRRRLHLVLRAHCTATLQPSAVHACFGASNIAQTLVPGASVVHLIDSCSPESRVREQFAQQLLFPSTYYIIEKRIASRGSIGLPCHTPVVRNQSRSCDAPPHSTYVAHNWRMVPCVRTRSRIA